MIEVYIRSVRRGFVYPHDRRHQQTEEGRKRASAESPGRGKLLGSAKQSLDFLVVIDMRRLASVTMRQSPAGGISVRGSMALHQMAKRRTLPKRQTQAAG